MIGKVRVFPQHEHIVISYSVRNLNELYCIIRFDTLQKFAAARSGFCTKNLFSFVLIAEKLIVSAPEMFVASFSFMCKINVRISA